ncbi:TauD/TfdA family dioxygenase [Patescibacteria group bacterium]|nr:TauD/TfdA family dioxygenase [Patescibacteria group bacterium]
MESSGNCDKNPKQAFGSELAPEALLVSVHSSEEIVGSAHSIISLLDTYGVAIVQFEKEEPPRNQLLCFKELFGKTMSHDRSDDDDITEVAVIDESSVYPGISSRAYTFHTDGSYDVNPPPIVALRCEIPARQGGITQLASGKKLHDWLSSTDKEALESLYREDALFINRAAKSFSGAVFRTYLNNRLAIRYRADEAVRSPENSNVRRAVGLVHDFLSEEKNLVSFRLEAGQVLLTDNFTVLHGRTAFESDDPRKLHRLWFDGISSSEEQACIGFAPNE